MWLELRKGCRGERQRPAEGMSLTLGTRPQREYGQRCAGDDQNLWAWQQVWTQGFPHTSQEVLLRPGLGAHGTTGP